MEHLMMRTVVQQYKPHSEGREMIIMSAPKTTEPSSLLELKPSHPTQITI